MAEDIRPQDEIELDAKNQKLRIRGSDVLGIAQLVIICMIAYGGYKHDAEGAEKNTSIVSAIKESNQIQRETLNAQREANCLNRLSPEQRKDQDQINFCRDLGRGR